MKTHRIAAFAATLALAGLLATGCTKKEKSVQPEPRAIAVPITPTPGTRTVVVATPVVAAPPQPIVVDAAASWEAISGLTYEQRAEFVAGVARMEAQLDGQIGAIKAKRATMTTDTKDWDFAMSGLTDARSYLHSMENEVAGVTTPDTWNEEKEKVHQAWLKAQDAYDKVRTSTTN